MKTKKEHISRKLVAVNSPSWENLSGEDKKLTGNSSGSWSERAGMGEQTSQTFQTPEASPVQGPQLKDLELSWSERRVASPLGKVLVDGVANHCEWKRPADRKKKWKKKEKVDDWKLDEESDSEKEMNKDNGQGGDSEEGRGGMREMERGECDGDSIGHENVSAGLGEIDKSDGGDVVNEPASLVNSSDSENFNSSSQSQNDSHNCNTIHERMCSTDSNTSGGFEPSQDSSNDDHEMSFADTVENKIDDAAEMTIKESDGSTAAITDFGSKDNNSGNAMVDTFSVHSNVNATTVVAPVVDADKDHNFLMGAHDDEEIVGTDRYHSLLEVLSEFLNDFFNNIREVRSFLFY